MEGAGDARHHLFWRGAPFALDAIQKIGHHGDVDDEHEDLDRCWTVEDLVDLDGHERGRDDDGEPLGPAFHQPQTDAFGEEQACIDKTDNSEFPDLVGRNVGCFFNGMADEAAAGIEAEHRYPPFELRAHILVYQLENSEANDDERRRL